MPHVIVKLTTGRSEQLKQEITAAVTAAIASSAHLSEDLVSVSIEEFEQGDWADKVFKPEITDRPETLYKKPGYTPG
ncbi:tautomerase family protein [Acidisoma cellulosilytica]|uniref:Tautomerase family protein n=1 Tax=Acidisoma cellulosilyticum TaxID=2802395 RepID=A0A963Z3U8_9PROT|nr:tautomerase family protein [Acidisoma cellulosilyticum]MCB8882319.1 tautomerase family protein [Acidisoma cellulosilyticum]